MKKSFCIKVNSFFDLKIDSKGFLVLFFCFKLKKRKLSFFLSLLKTLKKKIIILFLGLTTNYIRRLELVGVGYRALVEKSSKLVLKVGFSHNICFKIPKNTNIFCPKETLIILKSPSKDSLGHFISQVQNSKKPDSYKNKGILRCEKILNKKKFKKK